MEERHMNAGRHGGIIAAAGAVLAGVSLIVLPSGFGINGMDGGYALQILIVLVGITGLSVLPLMVKRHREFSALLSGTGLVASWIYTHEQWAQANASRRQLVRVRNKALLICVDGMLLFAALVFLIWNPENAGLGVAAILMGIGGVVALAAFRFPWLSEHSSRRHPPAVYIGKDGLVYGRELHVWKGALARLKSVSYDEDKYLLTVVYSTVGKPLKQDYPVYIPVPPNAAGEAKRAEEILGALASPLIKRSSK